MHTLALIWACLALVPAPPESNQAPAPRTPDPALTVQIGQLAPKLTIEEWHQLPDGAETPTLKDLRGKVVILEFWGPYCAPCIAAFPHLNELIEEFEDEPVAFISVGDQPYDPGCKRILDKRPVNSWLAFDHDISLFKAFGVYAMPRTVIIDKDGNVAAYTTPTKLTPEVLRAVLKGEPVESHYKPDQFKKYEEPSEG